MLVLVIALFVFALVAFPHFRNIVFHPLLVFYYAPKDLYKYLKYRRWRECNEYGSINMYCSNIRKVFGNGKTLSGVNYIRNVYKKYNGKMIYDFDNNEWIEQKIVILSNVMLKDISYIHLYNSDQIVNRHEVMQKGEVLLVFIDEAGIIFNSRNFQDNIGQDLLNAMLTCRKKKFGMFFTAQRFNQVDALIRQLTSWVFMAEKMWRSVVLRRFSGYDMEYCTNPQYISSDVFTYFATDALFRSYDTNQGVEDLKKAKKNGAMLSNKEILENQGNTTSDINNARLNKRYYKKVVRK